MTETAGSATLSCGTADNSPLLRRATHGDLDRIVEIQRAAYARNRALLGLEPLPLLADYNEVFKTLEVWLHEDTSRDERTILAVLILEVRDKDLLIFSVATDPESQSAGIGRQLLSAADIRAQQLGRGTVRLYIGSTLRHLVDWYSRHGFAIEQIEQLHDRAITHMVKHLN